MYKNIKPLTGYHIRVKYMYRRNMRKLVDGKGAARIAEYLHRFLENKKLEAEYARRMLELVDGKGCERIVEVLCSK